MTVFMTVLSVHFLHGGLVAALGASTAMLYFAKFNAKDRAKAKRRAYGGAMKQAPTTVKLSTDINLEARHLYWMGWSIAQISSLFDVPDKTLYARRKTEKWDRASAREKNREVMDARYTALVLKEQKTALDLKEIETLGREFERLERREKYAATGKDSDLNPNIKKRNAGKKAKQNAISDEQAVKLLDAFHAHLFQYQNMWLDAKCHRTRNILKSRQIGATWYFAREALCDALETGDNQIFLSASKAQAHVFRSYIRDFVLEHTDIDLRGDPIVLPGGAKLYFLSTNSRTAQSYHGHMYMDEYFWIPRFGEFNKVASGMAVHKKWRKTYFSTPSSLAHEAYPFWAGHAYSKSGDTDTDPIDISHTALKHGTVCPDGQWRHIVTLYDAADMGCDLFDIDVTVQEYAPDAFQNLFMCQFVDDALSAFRLKDLMRCTVDSLLHWTDFNPDTARPFGNRPVWIGYDPSRSRDNASLAVIAPPDAGLGANMPYRVLETFSWQNLDFEAQAKKIKDLTTRYNVEKIAIDASGIGLGVYEMVAKFFPRAVKITYNVEVKSRLVLRLMQLVRGAGILWDGGRKSIASAFMTIKKTTTTSGNATTFKASRTQSTGHADTAWAIMHAFEGVALAGVGGSSDQRTSFVDIY